MANLCLATEVTTIEDMETPSKHGLEAKQTSMPKPYDNVDSPYNSGKLVPTLRKDSSGMSRNSLSESSQPMMSPTLSVSSKLGSESGSGKWMGSPLVTGPAKRSLQRSLQKQDMPALQDVNGAGAPAVPEFKRTGTAEFDVNASIMRVGSQGLERFDSRGEIQRMNDDDALPGIVMVHHPIEAIQVKVFIARMQASLLLRFSHRAQMCAVQMRSVGRCDAP